MVREFHAAQKSSQYTKTLSVVSLLLKMLLTI